jgi:hypothetical protein
MKYIAQLYPSVNLASWRPLMFGSSWINGGECYEYGADVVTEYSQEFHIGIHTRLNSNAMQAELICSVRQDGTNVDYAIIDQLGYVCWEGREYYNNQLTRVKHYATGNWFNNRLFFYDVGDTYDQYDICPLISYCVGDAKYDDTDEVEIFFVCTAGTSFLDKVAEYYQLPIPYGEHHVHTLNTDPKLYRAGHFDIFGLGPGRFHPLVLASITFINKKPERLLLYTFQRPWEFNQSLDIDYF